MLQSPTVLPCLPLTPNKVSDLEMTPDGHTGPPSLRLLSKPSGDTLSNSLRRRAAVTRALAGSFLQSPRDAQMINVRDLGAYPCAHGVLLCFLCSPGVAPKDATPDMCQVPKILCTSVISGVE